MTELAHKLFLVILSIHGLNVSAKEAELPESVRVRLSSNVIESLRSLPPWLPKPSAGYYILATKPYSNILKNKGTEYQEQECSKTKGNYLICKGWRNNDTDKITNGIRTQSFVVNGLGAIVSDSGISQGTRSNVVLGISISGSIRKYTYEINYTDATTNSECVESGEVNEPKLNLKYGEIHLYICKHLNSPKGEGEKRVAINKLMLFKRYGLFVDAHFVDPRKYEHVKYEPENDIIKRIIEMNSFEGSEFRIRPN